MTRMDLFARYIRDGSYEQRAMGDGIGNGKTKRRGVNEAWNFESGRNPINY